MIRQTAKKMGIADLFLSFFLPRQTGDLISDRTSRLADVLIPQHSSVQVLLKLYSLVGGTIGSQIRSFCDTMAHLFVLFCPNPFGRLRWLFAALEVSKEKNWVLESLHPAVLNVPS